MRRTAAIALVLTATTAVAISGCAAAGTAGAAGRTAAISGSASAGSGPGARPSVVASAAVIPAGGPNPQAAIPNPGTGTGNQLLVRALLPQSASGRLRALLLPPAVVALPDRDRGSLFIPLRQAASGVAGPPECLGWTAGLWLELVTSFNEPGVQLAVTQQSVPAGSGWPVFSEAIITGPAAVLHSMADPALPDGCRTITSQTVYPGGIRALAAARLGLGSRAYEVTGTGKFPVWTWAEVVQGPGFLVEVRIPVQSGLRGSAAPGWLGNITGAAYRRAETTLR